MKAGFKLIQSIKDGVQTPPAGIATLGLDKGATWIRHFEPGFARVEWQVSPAYFNLEGAVICSWLACLADQVVFYATNTLLEDGEVTRVQTMNLSYIENVTGGTVTIEGRVLGRVDDVFTSECRFVTADGKVATIATVTTRVVPAAQ